MLVLQLNDENDTSHENESLNHDYQTLDDVKKEVEELTPPLPPKKVVNLEVCLYRFSFYDSLHTDYGLIVKACRYHNFNECLRIIVLLLYTSTHTNLVFFYCLLDEEWVILMVVCGDWIVVLPVVFTYHFSFELHLVAHRIQFLTSIIFIYERMCTLCITIFLINGN